MTTPRRVAPAEAHRLRTSEGYVYVDVRSVEEFDEGHPSGAFNVPWQVREGGRLVPNAEFLRVMRARFPRETRLVLGCHSGARSLAAASALLADGFVDVVDQRAGWAGVRDDYGRVVERGWRAEGLPESFDAEPERAYERLRASAGDGA